MLCSLMLLNDQVLARLIPDDAGLPSSIVWPASKPLLGVVVALGATFSSALCSGFGILGLWLLQRSWLCRIAAGLAFLGQIMNSLLWFSTHTGPLPPNSLVLLGLGVILCGVPTLQSRLLPRWNVPPLILGICLVGIHLSPSLQLPQAVLRFCLFFAPVGSLETVQKDPCLIY
jgi:hypothetical protein